MAIKKNIDTSTWKAVEWLDIHPGPGCFMGERGPYTVHGIEVQANNWIHAEYIWALTVCEEAGHDSVSSCAHCGAGIRYVVICQDADGKHHPVGETCAEYIEAKCDRSEWAEKRLIGQVKEAKNGSFYLSGKLHLMAPWYWGLPKEERPDYVRTSKYKDPGKFQEEWYLTIWGADASEVVRSWGHLRSLKAAAIAGQEAKAAQALVQEQALRAMELSSSEMDRIAREGKALGLRASTQKTSGGYFAILRDEKNKVVWQGEGVHANRDHDTARATAALPAALRELRTRL